MPPLPYPAAANEEYDVIDLNIDDIPDDVTWFPYAEWLPATDDPSDAAPRLSSPQMISCGVKREYVTSAADTHPWWDAHRAPQLAFLPLPLESRPAPCSQATYILTGCGEPVHRVASSLSVAPSDLSRPRRRRCEDCVSTGDAVFWGSGAERVGDGSGRAGDKEL
ncbi:hypothetical protein DFH08DRAFT_520683 [Mycena albidolilacea]|uniref:Uncharacterized protein n=1 Tax=Mycena albidolilacea TaxID=1033008 RepID=A0AAD6Z2F6_9AGAR|nr:hypothetical protein DFH08DRAFT_520683 [Mycena albidolilacea]